MPGTRQARTRRRGGRTRPPRPRPSARVAPPLTTPGPADLQRRLGNAGTQSFLTAQTQNVASEPAADAAPVAQVAIELPAAAEPMAEMPVVAPVEVAANVPLASTEADAPTAAPAEGESAATGGAAGGGGAQAITAVGDPARSEGGGAGAGEALEHLVAEAVAGGEQATGGDNGETIAVGAGGGGAGPQVELLMPPPPEGLSEADTGRINTVSGNARRAGAAQEQLPSAAEGVTEARAAVTEPVEETAARAEGQLVAALGEQPAPSPEIEALCKRMREVIHSRQPPDEESLIDSVPREEAEAAGQTLESAVESDTDQVRSGYDELDEAPAGEPQQTGEELVTPASSVDTPSIGAEQAVPDAVPAENVSLDADTERSAAAMEDAGMESEPAQLVENGPIAEARDAQGELGELAERGPEEVLAEQSAERDSAMADMAALQAQALESLTASRASSASTLGSQQSGMVTTEEQLRTQISTQARTIFTTAQTQVDTLLEPLVPTAIRRWETEIAILSGRFEADLRQVKEWLDERYEGVGGTLLELWEGVVGKPDWVTRAYNRAEENFGDGVCSLLREISTEINTVVATCEQIIDDANNQIEQLFSDLPEGLQEWAESERARYSEELSNLHNRVTSARDSLTNDIAGRAAGAVQEVRERIHELRQAAGGLLGRVMDAVGRFLDDPVKFIIEGLLELVGIPPASFWAVVNKIQSVISDIADDPLNFANNLASALGQGFQRFFDNFADHILGGFFDWLFSGLGAVGVTIPSDFSLKSIITFFLELMGITWPNIRQILARHIGEENVELIEKAYELVANLIELGPEGIFEMIKEQLNPQNILDMVVDAAIDFMIEALIAAVTPRVIAMFNPAGALIQALEVVYRILKWIFENAARIFSLIETVVNGAAELIAGNLSGMATAVEGALARLIAPVIDFLAGFLGLGDLPDKIADTIRGFQQMVLDIIDRVVAWLADKAKSLLSALGIGGDEEEADVDEEGNIEKSTTMNGEKHTLKVDVDDGDVTLASEEKPAIQKIDTAIQNATKGQEENPDDKRYGKALTQLNEMKSQLQQILGLISKDQMDDITLKSLKALSKTIMNLMKAYGAEFEVSDVVDPLPEFPGPVAGLYGQMPEDEDPPPGKRTDHHVPPVALSKAMKAEVDRMGKEVASMDGDASSKLGGRISNAAGKIDIKEHGKGLSAIRINEATHKSRGGAATHSSSLAPFVRAKLDSYETEGKGKRVRILSSAAKQLKLPEEERKLLVNPRNPNFVNFLGRAMAFVRSRGGDTRAAQAILDEVGEQFEGLSTTKQAALEPELVRIIEDWLYTAFEDAYVHTKGIIEVALDASYVDGSREEQKTALDNLDSLAESSWKSIYDPF